MLKGLSLGNKELHNGNEKGLVGSTMELSFK